MFIMVSRLEKAGVGMPVKASLTQAVVLTPRTLASGWAELLLSLPLPLPPVR